MIKTNGVNDIDLEGIIISTSAGTGIGSLVDVINKHANELETRATSLVELSGSRRIQPTPTNDTVTNLKINGIVLGDINNILPNDNDAKLVAAINHVTSNTGVIASINSAGSLVLTTVDGRGIKISADKGLDILGIPKTKPNAGPQSYEYYGRLTIIRNDARDAIVRGIDLKTNKSIEASAIGFASNGNRFAPAETVINLRSVRGPFTVDQASAIGKHGSYESIDYKRTNEAGKMPTGVTTFVGAQAVIDIADTATKMLDKIRSDLGSVQIQLEATVNNISTTQTNVKFSESQIRDVDYSTEVSRYKKNSILAQAGNYALSQSNITAQSVLKLLQ
ncbi:Flagellin [hydrothermal vent metagenome]|uniref:Flagellin n=1 Tax=hydrothermal vent metagenome TaxID=652676 RepID=A0A3B1DSM7_9ZZZZ